MFAYEKEKDTVTSRYGALRVFNAVKYDLFATETIPALTQSYTRKVPQIIGKLDHPQGTKWSTHNQPSVKNLYLSAHYGYERGNRHHHGKSDPRFVCGA